MTSRKIKFRFFCPAAKGFIQNYNYQGAVDDLFNGEDKTLILSQCTEVDDDYGNKIWEGDIVEFTRKDRNMTFTAVIEFVEGAFLANIVKYHGTISFFWFAHVHLNDYKTIKVIGNKFENPELL